MKLSLSLCLVAPAISLVAAELSSPFQFPIIGSDQNFQTDDIFQWSKITPTKHLIFHPCYEEHECARLDVPMNYNRTDGKGSRVALAIVRYPSKVDVTDSRYGGAILLNPGGPGGSGVTFATHSGKSIQNIVDATNDPSTSQSADDKYFDIISWDPRGVGQTEPRIVCYPDSGEHLYWNHLMRAERSMGTTPELIGLKIARSMALSTSCSQRLMDVGADEDSIAENVNTPSVVADMVSIIEALGEWREKEAEQILVRRSIHANSEIIERTRWRRGEEKLLYFGFSYGTILGASFAAIEPQRVGRLAIDGIANLADYYETQLSSTSLLDTDLGLRNLFGYCAQAGPEKCSFARPDSTAESLEERFKAIVESLTAQPLPVFSADWNGTMFGVVTQADLIGAIFVSLYNPLTVGALTMDILNDLEQGNGTLLNQVTWVLDGPHSWCPTSGHCSKKQDKPFQSECSLPMQLALEQTMAILCADSISSLSPDLGDVRKSVEDKLKHSTELSTLFGPQTMDLQTLCPGWKAKSTRLFTLPENVTTSHPLLIMGNTADPVCPLASAYNTSSKFIDSVVLTNNGTGHCAVSAPSLCLVNHIKNYFQTGTLPDAGTVCHASELPFIGWVGTGEIETQSAENQLVLDGVKKVSSGIIPIL